MTDLIVPADALPDLRESDVDADPFRQFRAWMEYAQALQVPQPNAMALATATPESRPSVRMVLLGSFDERGFLFFTDYESRKARELERNPWAALVFHWEPCERQVRVEGRVELASAEESDVYWSNRPRGSQISASVSRQSQVVATRELLERQVDEITQRYEGQNVPRPPKWGGYRVIPDAIEFWQGRLHRLHDRLRYQRLQDGSWLIERLSP